MAEDDRTTQRAERKIDQARRRYEHHGKVFRTMWVLVGFVVLLAGVAMIVFPGPVTIVIPAGLAMLAVVFRWARRLLLASVRKGVEAKHQVDATSTKVKVLGALALGCLAAAVAAGAWFAWAGG